MTKTEVAKALLMGSCRTCMFLEPHMLSEGKNRCHRTDRPWELADQGVCEQWEGRVKTFVMDGK